MLFRSVLINITGGPDLTLHEVNEAATCIQEEADEDANIIFGAVIDESMGDEVRITVIATGFGEPAVKQQAPRPSMAEVRTAPEARPTRQMGRIVDDELDVPTWQRRNQEPPVAADRSAPRRSQPVAAAGDDEYDIPTFLRRGAE